MADTKPKIGVYSIIKKILLVFGVLFLSMVILALTPVPFYMHYHLGDDPNQTEGTVPFVPESVVMFGGAGMPSESNLIRLYYTAEYANHFQIPVVIVHPKDSVCQAEMSRILMQSGVALENIDFMTEGANTRSQALALREACPELLDEPFVVITSPENIRRTVKSLNKAGFNHVKGVASREATVDFDLSLKKQQLKGNKALPSVESTNIRYTFWNYFKLEITCLREYAALAYYKVKGWI